MNTIRKLAILLLGLACVGCAERKNEKVTEDIPPAAVQQEIEIPQQQTQKENKMVLSAYLPVQSVPVDEKAAQRITDIIFIGGVVWDIQGKLLTGNDEIFTHLDAVKKYDELDVWVTVNPSGKLIRAGQAGMTIDTEQERKILAETITDFAVEHSLCGIDIDWEFPANNEEWNNFSQFVPILKSSLEKEGKQLSLAFYPQNVQLDATSLAACDRINIMAYDQFDESGVHSSFETAVKAVEYFKGMGCSNEQLILGIPLYGRPTDQSARWDLYNTLPTVSQPSVNNYGDSWYNGIELILKKTEYAHSKSLGGVMIYHLACDLPAEDEMSALKNISDFLTSIEDKFT
ncbi:MAG: hypothetical protein IKV41_05205 [Oscillospiraceae bacterium]|nr:hypothetical protein [Oscillospiraceae bacterium]